MAGGGGAGGCGRRATSHSGSSASSGSGTARCSRARARGRSRRSDEVGGSLTAAGNLLALVLGGGVAGVGCETLTLVLLAFERGNGVLVLGKVGRETVVADAGVGKSVL